MAIMKKFLFVMLLLLNQQAASAEEYSWKKLDTEPYKGKQDDIFFVDEYNGWYVNGYGKIYHTVNGGATWAMQLEQKGTFFRCIAFVDTLTGFAGTVGTDYFPNVTDTTPLYKTTDGGKTWQAVAYKGHRVKGLCALDIVREPFNNHGELGYKIHIYGVGRVGSPASLMTSHDGGATFASMDMAPYCAALYDIKMFSKNEGFACASSDIDIEKGHAMIIKTTNGGATWKRVYESNRPFENCWKMHFPSKEVGYATVQSYNPDTTLTVQRFVKTTNGGKSWKEYKLCDDYKARSFGVGFINEENGFIGTVSTGYQTADGGATWTKTDLGRACNKIRIVTAPDGRVYGYAIGVNVFKLVKQ